MQYLKAFLILLPLIIFSGCAAIPLPPSEQQYTKEQEVFETSITVGKTHKNDILKVLGEPNALHSDHFFIYRHNRDEGFVLLMFMHGGGAVIPVNQLNFSALMKFDEQGILTYYDNNLMPKELYDEKSLVRTFPTESLTRRQHIFDARVQGFFYVDKTDVAFNKTAFSPNGRLLGSAGFKLGANKAWSAEKIFITNLDDNATKTITTDNYTDVAFSPNFDKVALIKTLNLKVLDLKTRATLFELKKGFWSSYNISSIAFHPNGKLIATGHYDGSIKVWDISSKNQLFSFKGHTERLNTVISLAYSKDGQWLASGSESSVKLWDAKTGKNIASIMRDGYALQFSPNGNLLAIHRENHVELWQLTNADEPKLRLINAILIPEFQRYLNWKCEKSLAFSPDGKYLAAAHGTMVVYDLHENKKVLQFVPAGNLKGDTTSNDAVRSVAFHPDGNHIATGTAEGIYLWEIPQ